MRAFTSELAAEVPEFGIVYGGKTKTPAKNKDSASRLPPSDVTQYTATCGGKGGECDGCAVMECLKKVWADTTPPPYYALWQNSWSSRI